MFEEKLTIDKIEILDFNFIQVRKKQSVLKNGVEIASSFVRVSYTKNDVVPADEDPRLLAIAKVIWPNYGEIQAPPDDPMVISGSAE